MVIALLPAGFPCEPDPITRVNAGGVLTWMAQHPDGLDILRAAAEWLAAVRNPNTRLSYMHALVRLARWSQQRGLGLSDLDPVLLSTFVDTMPGAPRTKQRDVAAIRGLFRWLVNKGALRFSPATDLNAPKIRCREGSTPALSLNDLRAMLGACDVQSWTAQRDRALLATLFFTFGRSTAVRTMRVRDYGIDGDHRCVRLVEKGGQERCIPCHHQLVEALNAWLRYRAADGEMVNDDAPLFPSRRGSPRPLPKVKAWCRVRAVARRAGIANADHICTHSLRATGITEFRAAGGSLEDAAYIAGHANTSTTALYDRSQRRNVLGELERMQLDL